MDLSDCYFQVAYTMIERKLLRIIQVELSNSIHVSYRKTTSLNIDLAAVVTYMVNFDSFLLFLTPALTHLHLIGLFLFPTVSLAYFEVNPRHSFKGRYHTVLNMLTSRKRKHLTSRQGN